MHKKRWLHILALMLVMVLLLAACGNGDDGGDTTGGDTDTTNGDTGGDTDGDAGGDKDGDTGGDTGGGGGGDTGDMLYSDDFSDAGSGWESGDYETGAVGYAGGEYYVTQAGGSDFMWGQAFLNFENVDARADAYQLSGPGNDNTGYGLMCRVGYDPNTDELSGYWFGIGADGFYSIHKFTTTDIIALVDWESSSAINLGNNAVNQLRIVCDGSTLQFYVNGTLVAQASDSEFGSGDLAFGGVSFEDASAEFRFDNIEVYTP